MRSMVYLAAMAHRGTRAGLSVVMVETVYVTLTAGFYAGLQQKALGLRSRLLGNLSVVLAVPMLAQLFDWLAHRATGAVAPGKANVVVCAFAALSALFHLYVMRRGVFLTGHGGRTLADDLRKMPRLIGTFVLLPVTYILPPSIASSAAESEAVS